MPVAVIGGRRASGRKWHGHVGGEMMKGRRPGRWESQIRHSRPLLQSPVLLPLPPCAYQIPLDHGFVLARLSEINKCFDLCRLWSDPLPSCCASSPAALRLPDPSGCLALALPIETHKQLKSFADPALTSCASYPPSLPVQDPPGCWYYAGLAH